MAGAGVGGRRRGSEMGGEGGRGGTPVLVFVPVVAEIQVEYTEWSHILRILLQYEMEYILRHSGWVGIKAVLSIKLYCVYSIFCGCHHLLFCFVFDSVHWL